MSKLSEANIIQIKNMKADGKKGREIIDFFWNTYKIKLDESEISRAVHLKKYGIASAENPRRRSAQRKYAKKIKICDHEDQDELTQLIIQAYQLYKRGFLKKVEAVLETAGGGY